MTGRAAILAAFVAATLGCGQGGKEHVVLIRGMTFEPASLSVSSGDRVVWRNEDIVAHTATAAGRFDSGPIEAGKTFAVTVKKAGEIAYVCTLHPGMAGTLSVR